MQNDKTVNICFRKYVYTVRHYAKTHSRNDDVYYISRQIINDAGSRTRPLLSSEKILS